ncbi:hypothetical protein BGZ60DRAFT_531065 [Tricladium varicosporioides]|nr:hypothetical protein BGZ60DRAFT_531065 [Hymenoscyphus varicosporioides]
MTSSNSEDPAISTHAGPYPSSTFERSTSHSSSQPHQLSSASSYADLNYLFGTQDPAMLVPKPSRNRRKSSQGSEHTKHRRTRSGCYTCRSRRVKCDESHPVCERCRKGGRECVYPEPATSKTSSSSSKRTPASTQSPGSSSDDDEDGVGTRSVPLESIPDGDEDPGDISQATSNSRPRVQRSDTNQSKSETRNSSETPSLVQDKGASPTPSSEGSIGYATYQTLSTSRLAQEPGSLSGKSDWSHLPQDLQFYLNYYYDNISHVHYSLKFDPGDFMRTRYLDIALGNESLLYAVVGFSAFQRTLHNPGGKIQDFLQYYNKSVSLLLRSLQKGDRHSEGTILAILQLATIEEFLGDWINLLGHQKAAYQILTKLFTPQTAMQNETSRIILGWYMRFDVFAGLMGGFETVLSREWFSISTEFCHQMVSAEPNNLNWKIEYAISHHRLIATDMSLLFAKMGRGELSMEQFVRENAGIGTRIEEWKSQMDPAIQDSRYLVNDFSGCPPRDPNDIVDPYLPGIIYSGPLWVMNVAFIDWLSVDLMHKYQTALTTKTAPSEKLTQTAYECCQLFEALELWPGSPPGTLLACQASLGISCLFLPRDERHTMWARRKLAAIECNGYIYPYTFRTKMADLFRDRSCMHWWLPDNESYPPIIRSIRKFVEERTAPAKDVPTEDLRDMKAIFSSLKLEDDDATGPSPPRDKGKRATPQVAVATEAPGIQDMNTMMGNDGYGLGYDDSQGIWGGQQDTNAYGIPKQERYS